MINYILILSISFIVTLSSTPLVIKISYKKGALDYPNDRLLKIHSRPVPILGGIAISFGLFSSWLLISVLFKALQQEIFGLFLAFLLVLLFGLFDDIRGMNPGYRFLGQFVEDEESML